MGVKYVRHCPRCWRGEVLSPQQCTLCNGTRYVTIPGEPQVVQVLRGVAADVCTFRHLEADSEAETQPIDVDAVETASLDLMALARMQTKAQVSIAESIAKIEASLRALVDIGLVVHPFTGRSASDG